MTFFNVRIPGVSMTVIQADGKDVEEVEVDGFSNIRELKALEFFCNLTLPKELGKAVPKRQMEFLAPEWFVGTQPRQHLNLSAMLPPLTMMFDA